MTVTINGTTGITSPEVVLDNAAADGGQVVLKSSGYSNWNWDNYSGRLRAYYNTTEYFTIDTSGNVGIGTSSPAVKLDVNGSAYVRAGNIVGLYNSDNTNQYQIYNGGSSGTNIGQLVFVQGGVAERARIDSSGNLLVGTTAASAKLSVISNSASQAAGYFYTGVTSDVSQPALSIGKYDNNNTTSQKFVNFGINQNTVGSGQITANGASQAAFGSFSDARLKENIVALEPQLEKLMSLRPVEFDYKDGSGRQTGFIAQEFQEVYPDAIGETDGYLTLTGYGKTEARLIKAIQEQQAIITTLTARIEALEAKNA